jgi:uncharacterized membrane protein YdjX (TVP38/TMEM64 family)
MNARDASGGAEDGGTTRNTADASNERGRRLRIAGAVAVPLLLVALACAWRYTPLHDLLDPPRMLALGRRVRELPFAALWTLAAFLVGGLLVVPVVALIAVTGLVWGLVPGVLLSLAGAVLSAALTYSIGRVVSGDLVARHAGPKLAALNARLSRGGWWAVALVRLLPLAPFSVMNLLFGVLEVRPRDFLLGTAAGLFPGIVVTVAFAQSLTQVLHRPGASSVAMLGLAVLLLVALAIGTRRLLARRASKGPGVGRRGTGSDAAPGAPVTADRPFGPLRPAVAPIPPSPSGSPGTPLDVLRSKDS